ncbi:MAG TPA: response regulator transcription factor [Burkholderiaceae bacterium]|jgi:DNA-binding response OmpR family regulator
METSMRLLLVEDDAALAEALEYSLRKDGHAVDRVANGGAADRALKTASFDLVVLDLNLPVIDGLEVLRRMRGRSSLTPVLIVSARDDGDERVRGLDLGADDYLVKPFGIHELGARVRALLRRSGSVRSALISHGRLTFDTASRNVKVDDTMLELSLREVSLLEALLLNFGQVVSKEKLLSQMYGFDVDIGLNTIEVYIHRLRKKIGGSGTMLKTVHGRGYLLADDDTSGAASEGNPAPRNH